MKVNLLIIFSALPLLALTSCGSLLVYDPMEFPLESELQARPVSSVLNEMTRSRDKVLAGLGRAMAGLPDFHDGLTDREMTAAVRIKDLAHRAGPKEKALLIEISKYEEDPPQYSASLQGLLWMAQDDVLKPDTLKKETKNSLTKYAFHQLPLRFKTPENILDYLAAQYSYVLNRDTSQTLFQFFNTKYGDCNEFSLLAGYLLKKQGYRVFVLHTEPSIWGRHVSIIFKKKDGYYLMDPSRAAILRVLEKRKGKQPLQPVDIHVYDLIKGFGNIHGPVDNKKALAELYNNGRAEDMDYRIEAFEAYLRSVGGY